MRIRTWLVVGGVLLAALLAVVLTATSAPEPMPEPRPAALTQPAAVGVLRSWDAARSRAWADGDAAGLRALYVVGSGAGAADVGLLRRYLARGLRVRGMRRQLLAVRVVRSGPRKVALRVTDRLVGAEAVAVSGAVTKLPVSAPRTRLLRWRQVGGRWLLV